ncbi:Stk1 family PASTA domain-containing Ser/Thr kinase [Timonella sp. A28]|uniref:Stk1 family PASTA domain-containing Ser/Thr kinase n=1 Tax=Timonella sp. A28 TaxID=3442640 RepID=UPI003EB8A777
MGVTVNDALVGQLIDGRYLVQERIARGGMATVYKALDKRLDRTVALKVMHPHLAEGASGQNFVDRFQREARSAARLTHPGLVAVYDQGLDGEMSYLTLEFVEGTDLRKALEKNGTFSVGEALAIADDILDALALAHNNQLVHRDIKPENILISTENEVKITDFGLARAVTEVTSTTTGTILGTVAYLAPELVSTGACDTRSDVYAVGIMLYEMLTGRQPFVGESPINVAFQHVNHDVPSLSHSIPWVPNTLDVLVKQFTARIPDERPVNAAAALALLRSVQDDLSADVLAQRVARPLGRPGVLVDEDATTEHPIVRVSEHDSPFELNNAVLTEAAAGTSPHESDSESHHFSSQPHPTVALSATQSETLSFTVPTPTSPQEDEAAVPSASVAKKPKKRRRALWLVMLVVLLGGAGYGGYYWWNAIGPGAYMVVPADISGVSEADALKQFDSLPLRAVVTESFSDNIPEGEIISADPSSGERIKKHSTVSLVVSLGIEEHAVPKDMTGKTFNEVSAALEGVGFSNIVPDLKFDTKIKKNTVMKMSVKEGAMLPHNTEIVVTVSNGPEPITVPQISGETKASAEKILATYELQPKYTEQYSNSVAKGKVISQDPKQGTPGYRGDKVSVSVSLGPELVTVPAVEGMSSEEATQTLKDSGFKVEVNKYLDGFFDRVRFQDVKAGTKAPKGSTITLTIF